MHKSFWFELHGGIEALHVVDLTLRSHIKVISVGFYILRSIYSRQNSG